MPSSDSLLSVLLAVPAVMLACQAGGWAVRRFGQPPVIGEIIVGILLGPTLLGWVAPSLQHQILPTTVVPLISVLGDLALLAFLFLMGLELDLRRLRTVRHTVVSVSLCSILLPGALGAVLGFAMYPHLAPAGVGQLPFILFVAISLSITAFPVLARILDDKGFGNSDIGTFAMACAAIGDAIVWCLLIAVVALCTAGAPLSALTAVGLVIAFVSALTVLRPAMRTLLARAARRTDELVLVILCAGFFLSAYVIDQIGVHPAFGAFLFGAVIPRNESAVERNADRIRAVLIPAFLPLFFVSTGLQTNLTGLSFELWGWGLAILVVAVAGKWGGAAGAARLAGADWRWASAVGTLMNCRGLTELVVLGIGLQIGAITPQLYSVLVLMAVVTTTATAPLLSRLTRNDPRWSPQRLLQDPRRPSFPAIAQEAAK